MMILRKSPFNNLCVFLAVEYQNKACKIISSIFGLYSRGAVKFFFHYFVKKIINLIHHYFFVTIFFLIRVTFFVTIVAQTLIEAKKSTH